MTDVTDEDASACDACGEEEAEGIAFGRRGTDISGAGCISRTLSTLGRRFGSPDDAEFGWRLDAWDEEPADGDVDITGWRVNARRIDSGEVPRRNDLLRPQ